MVVVNCDNTGCVTTEKGIDVIRTQIKENTSRDSRDTQSQEKPTTSQAVRSHSHSFVMNGMLDTAREQQELENVHARPVDGGNSRDRDNDCKSGLYIAMIQNVLFNKWSAEFWD